MAIEFKLPDLGEDIETGDVVKVYVSPGDRVEKEQALMELETDKAALEIPSPAGGVIKEVHVKGETIKIGQLLVTIDDGAGGGEKAAEKKTEKEAPPKKEEPEVIEAAKKEKPKETER
jgi:pyruvate dehydrogenase E2 component (dihydrolipoamide acetyltransferase)